LVLVVDDDVDLREMIAEHLVLAGYRVETARSGPEAIQKARTLGPSVILLDVAMPKMTGLETTRALKADRTTRKIPIIAVSGHGEETVAAMRVVGARSGLQKPFAIETLIAAIREAEAERKRK
jgi:two-component system cell cycle response regulator DivK